jgi:hypothetical protein
LECKGNSPQRRGTGQIKIAAITKLKKTKLKVTVETNSDIVMCSGVNRSTRAQTGAVIWIHKQITAQLLTTHTGLIQ